MSREQPTYPVFIQPNDDLTSTEMHVDGSRLSWHEQIDVEDGLYSGWDREGYPFRLVWSGRNDVRIEMTGENTLPDELREAVLCTSRLRDRSPTFDADAAPNDIVGLYRAIEAWELETRPPRLSLLERLRRLLKADS